MGLVAQRIPEMCRGSVDAADSGAIKETSESDCLGINVQFGGSTALG